MPMLSLSGGTEDQASPLGAPADNPTPQGAPQAAPAPAPATAPASPAPTPGIWHRVVQGALMGLEGGGLGGAVLGAAGSISKKGFQDLSAANQAGNQETAMGPQVRASKIKFQDAQAAALVKEAALRDKELHTYDQTTQDTHNTAVVNQLRDLNSSFGPPDLVVDNHGAGANAALEGLTQTDGAVPSLLTFNVGDKIVAYRMDKLVGNPASVGLINKMRQVTGMPDLTQSDWQKTPKQVQDQWLKQASDFFLPVADGAANLPIQAQQFQQYRDTYAGKPNADPAILKQLDDKLAFIKKAQAGVRAEKRGESYDSAFAQKSARDAADRENYQKFVASAGDITGWKPSPNQSLSEQQIAAAQKSFATGPLTKALDTERSFQMYQDAFAKRNDAQTGAGSMLALSQHLGTTFGVVKGVRVTKDMIEEHLKARNVSDEAQVAVQKLVNGDRLSEGQWKEFGGLIADSRMRSWSNTVRIAHSIGIPVTKDMVPPNAIRIGANKAGKRVFSFDGGKTVESAE